MSLATTQDPGPEVGAKGLLAWYRSLNAKHLVTFLNTLILVTAEWLYGGLGGYDRLAVALAAGILT